MRFSFPSNSVPIFAFSPSPGKRLWGHPFQFGIRIGKFEVQSDRFSILMPLPFLRLSLAEATRAKNLGSCRVAQKTRPGIELPGRLGYCVIWLMSRCEQT